MKKLEALNKKQDWNALFDAASKMTREEPKRVVAYGYAAHALRQLKRLEEGFEWAQRGLEVDDEDLFVLNRASLLANLTKRYEVAWNLAVQNAARRPAAASDQFNLAILLVNGIHGGAQLGHIAEAVTRFTPVIEALDHPELHFNAACLYSLAHDERAINWVRKSLHHGKPKADFADADFDWVRSDARFEAALARDWEREKAALARADTTDREKLTPEHFIDVKQFRFRSVGEDEHSDELTTALSANAEVATVYADWFEERGNPRAQFIRESLACERAVTEDERMLAFARWADVLHENAALLLAPLDDDFDDVRITWKHGFPTSLHVMSPVLPNVLEHPAYRLLRELRVDGPVELNAVKRAFPGLRSLWLNDDELDVSDLDLHFPQLEVLGLAAYSIQPGRLLFTQLRELTLRTSALLPSHLAVLRNVPKLEALSLVEDDGSGCELDDFDVLFELKSLRRLRLSVLEIDRLCERLPRMKLDVLDLSSSPLTELGAESLRRHARALSKLKRIDVRDTPMGEDARRELKRALPNTLCE